MFTNEKFSNYAKLIWGHFQKIFTHFPNLVALDLSNMYNMQLDEKMFKTLIRLPVHQKTVSMLFASGTIPRLRNKIGEITWCRFMLSHGPVHKHILLYAYGSVSCLVRSAVFREKKIYHHLENYRRRLVQRKRKRIKEHSSIYLSLRPILNDIICLFINNIITLVW